MNTVWQAGIKDDVSSVASKMSINLAALDKRASDLFADSGGNFKKFRADLDKSGVSAVDATLIVAKYRKELVATRKETLGLGKAQVDVFEQAAKAAEKAAREQEKIAERAARAAQKASAQTKSDTGMGGKLFTAANFATVATTAYGVLDGIAGKVADVGKDFLGAVLDAAQFRQNALSGLEYMLGSKEEAVDIFKQAQLLAQETPLDTDKVITGIKQLVTSGFTGKESMLLFKAVADQASKFADDPAMQEKVIAAMSRVKGRGVATGEDLESFRVAGFRAENIVEALRGKQNLAPLFKGITSKDTNEDVIKKVKKVLGEGKIGAYDFINAAIASLEKGGKDGDKDIGEFAKKMGKVSITGTISNFKSAFGDLLKSTDIQSWKGIESFKNFLTRITEAMSPASESGQRLLSIFENITNSLLGGLDSIESSDIEGFVKKIGDVADYLVKAIKSAWSWLDRLIHEGSSGEFLDDIKDLLVDVGVEVGIGIAKGMKEGVKEGAKGLLGIGQEDYISKYGYEKNTLANLAKDQGMSLKKFLPEFLKAQEAFKTAGMNSWILGGTEGQARDIVGYGKSQGIIGGGGLQDVPKLAAGGIVTSPTFALVGEAGPEAVVPLSTMGGYNADGIQSLRSLGAAVAGTGGTVIHIGGIHVNGVDVSDGNAIGTAAAQSFEAQAMNFFARKAAEA